MKLSAAKFNTLLANMGQSLLWSASQACPCANPYSGAADPECLHCNGKGRIWGDPQVSSAGIVSRDAGDVMLVLPSDQSVYALGELDRVILTDRTEPFSMNLIAGTNSLRCLPVAVDRVTWIENGALVSGDLPCHYEDGQLQWSGAAPPGNFAVTGRRHPEYFCWQTLPLDRPHHHGEALPRRVILRRFDLFGS